MKREKNLRPDLCRKLPRKEWLLYALIPILVFFVSRNWYQLMLIRGNSMYPAYRNMQFVILDRHEEQFTYGDVIAFRCDGLSDILVKRIVACPGDTAVIEDGTLLVNGTESEAFPQHGAFQYAGILKEAVILGENQYLVIGDNIAQSKDSRYPAVGCVSGDTILGKVL